MAQEPFLINPPKRLKRRRRNPVGETLITIGANPMTRNPWKGHSTLHRRAALMRWGKLPKGSVHFGKRKRRRAVSVRKKSVRRVVHTALGSRRVHDRRTSAYRAERLAQQRQAEAYLGMFTGAGKKRKFKYVRGKGYVRFRKNPLGGFVMAKRRRKRHSNSWVGQPRKHRKAALKGWRRGHKIGKRRVKHYRRNPGETYAATNPRRRHRRIRRSYRHNPSLAGTFGKFTSGIADVRGWAPLAVTGGLSAITGSVVPSLVGVVNPWAKLGVQLAVAVGGGIAVEQVVDKRHGQAWMIVGVSMVGYQLLKQFVLVPMFPQFAVGLGAYNDYILSDVSQRVGAYPTELHAFPTAMSAYPGVGEDEEDAVGAYPYDGTGY